MALLPHSTALSSVAGKTKPTWSTSTPFKTSCSFSNSQVALSMVSHSPFINLLEIYRSYVYNFVCIYVNRGRGVIRV